MQITQFLYSLTTYWCCEFYR